MYIFDSMSRTIWRYAWLKSSNENHLALPKYWNADLKVGIGDGLKFCELINGFIIYDNASYHPSWRQKR